MLQFVPVEFRSSVIAVSRNTPYYLARVGQIHETVNNCIGQVLSTKSSKRCVLVLYGLRVYFKTLKLNSKVQLNFVKEELIWLFTTLFNQVSATMHFKV